MELNSESNNENVENFDIKRDLPPDKYDKSIKVILLGDSNVGKSSLINKLINKKFLNVQSTLSIEYHTYIISINEYVLRMQLWDTAGQEKFNSIIDNYYKGADIGIFLYSIDKEESFEHVKDWYNNLQSNNTYSKNILLGNKTDLDENERKITKEQGEIFAKEKNFFLFKEISCKSDQKNELDNIIDVFDTIGKYYYKCRRNVSVVDDSAYIASSSIIDVNLKSIKKKKKQKKCC